MEKQTDCGSLPEKSSLFEGSENQISNLCLINNSCPNDKQSDLTYKKPPQSYNYHYNYYYVKNVTVKSSAKLLHHDGECDLIRFE